MNLQLIFNTIINWISKNGIKLIIGLIGLWIGWKLINKLIIWLNILFKKQNIDLTLVSFFNAFADIALKILLIIAFIGFLGVPTASFTAILASAGLSIGLALQGSLSNFAGGVIILLIRPFKVGDYIETSLYQGTIEKK